MDEATREDFISEMYVLPREEGFLYEAPLGATDRLPSGDVVHGPWNPDDCAKVLRRWHVEGWISLCVIAPGEPDHELSPLDSRQLLSAPARWQPQSEDGLTSVVLTDAGADVPFERWRQLALATLAEG